MLEELKEAITKPFDLLVFKYQSRTIGIAMKFVKDLKNSGGCGTKIFFIKVFKSLDSFREESAFYTWFYRITSKQQKIT
ncbi:MAG: hypothetical protein CM1200mP12_02120 [Gammaproteobacteria bacterium]|nr:MAG: hypothetical protein CM1200mP12_02120 [Gammaproteobacteria bacterium]